MLVSECPECGKYTSEPDGCADTFVEEERCDRCRNREREFDLGFAEYQESQRRDFEEA